MGIGGTEYPKTHLHQLLSHGDNGGLVGIADTKEYRTLRRWSQAGGHLSLGQGQG